MQKTENYNLNQWESHDEIKVEDFNADNAAVDGALRALNTAVEALSEERIYIGSYVGDGTSSRTIPLPWEPKFAIIMGHYSTTKGMLTVLTQEMSFYSTDGDWKLNVSTNLRMENETLIIAHTDYNNVSNKVVSYILIR